MYSKINEVLAGVKYASAFTALKLGDVLKLPLNTERLSKLTETYIVSNQKLKNAINKPLPVSAKEGLLKTFNSFNNAQ